MSQVTLTITVDCDEHAAHVVAAGGSEMVPSATSLLASRQVSAAVGADLGAPPLDSMSGDDSIDVGLEADADGAPPLELTELGMSEEAADRAAAVGDMSPPQDFDDPPESNSDAVDGNDVSPADVGEPDQ